MKTGNDRMFLKKEAAAALMAKTLTERDEMTRVEVGVPVVNRVTMQPSILFRIWASLVVRVLSPDRTARLMAWLVETPLQTRAFLVAILGPRVDRSTYDKRMGECLRCPMASRVLIYRAPFVATYCKSCRCPKWPLAELSRKNRLRNWACPVGRFPGKPEPRGWKAVMEQEANLQVEIGIQAQKDQSRSLPISGCAKPGCNGSR